MWSNKFASRGFSLLELVIVIVIISTLATMLLSRLLRTQADAEQATMESVVGTLRSALGLKMAELYLHSDKRGMRSLARSNPMAQLSQKPGNYLGELRKPDFSKLNRGSWYFDKDKRVLVYMVNNTEYFTGGRRNPARARFLVRLVYRNKKAGSRRARRAVEGVNLVSVEPYKWKNQ